MNDLSKRATRKPDVPEEIQARWQRIADLMGRVVGVPAGLIMRVDWPQIEVFLSIATEGNPYQKEDRHEDDRDLESELETNPLV